MDPKYNARVEKYRKDQIMDITILENVKTTMEHWNGWRKFDNSIGATAKIYMKIDAKGIARVYKYVTKLGDLKNIYIIEEVK